MSSMDDDEVVRAAAQRDLLRGITPLEDGSFSLEPGFYWITINQDPNGWYRDALASEEAFGNIRVFRRAKGLPARADTPEFLEWYREAGGDLAQSVLNLPDVPQGVWERLGSILPVRVVPQAKPEPGDWILFQVLRPMVWRMPYLGVYAWGPFRATRGAETLPEDVGQDPPTRPEWWQDPVLPSLPTVLPWGLLALAGAAFYLTRKFR